MKISSLGLPLFLALSPILAAAPPAPPPPPAAHLSLRFEKVPLGNVARILSARFNVNVSIVSNARAPITGDFSKMDLRQALEAAGRQSGLVVVPLGPGAAAGYSLSPPEAAPAEAQAGTKAANPDNAEAARIKAKLEDAALQRQELLRREAGLLEQSSASTEPGS